MSAEQDAKVAEEVAGYVAEYDKCDQSKSWTPRRYAEATFRMLVEDRIAARDARQPVWIVRQGGDTWPMQVDTVWTTEEDATARAAARGPGWYVMKYWSIPTKPEECPHGDLVRDAEITERAIRAESERDTLLIEKIEQGLRAGKLLGPEFDGASIERLAQEIVTLRRRVYELEVRELKAQLVTWQPIETAPKNGTRVLVRYDVQRSSRVVGAYSWNGWSWMSDDVGKVQPTHWMPLPSTEVQRTDLEQA
jgi:hypothetical protein